MYAIIHIADRQVYICYHLSYIARSMDGEERLEHSCNRCGWHWMSRLPRPKACAKCHSPYWNKERVRELAKASG